MLTMSVRPEDLHGRWVYDGENWRSGPSRVTPLRHPCLQTLLVSNGAARCLVVRERRRVDAPHATHNGRVDGATYRQVLTESRRWPLDVCLVEITEGSMVIEVGTWGSAPMYLCRTGGTLLGSWDLMDLRRVLRVDRLRDREVMRLLTYQQRYTRDTVFEEVFELTERSTARFDHTGLVMTYPPPADHALPREPAPDADVVGAFEGLLASVLAQRAVAPAETLVQISGGMDSSTVAMTLARPGQDRMLSCGIVIAGEAARQQQHRRCTLVDAGGYTDLTVTGTDYAPLCPTGPRRRGELGPVEEPYAEASDVLLEQAAGCGGRVVFSGFGGDELMYEPVGGPDHRVPAVLPWLGERTLDLFGEVDADLPPPSVVPATTLLAVASTAPLALRRGFWPISPLASPDLVRFCEWLPPEWRRGKRLMRALLTRHGLPAEVVRPALRENLGGVMDHGLHHHAAPLLRRWATGGGLLVEFGYLDRRGLRQAAEQAMAGLGFVDRRVFAAIALELALQELVAAC